MTPNGQHEEFGQIFGISIVCWLLELCPSSKYAINLASDSFRSLLTQLGLRDGLIFVQSN